MDCSLLWWLSWIGQGCVVCNPRQQNKDAPCGHSVAVCALPSPFSASLWRLSCLNYEAISKSSLIHFFSFLEVLFLSTHTDTNDCVCMCVYTHVHMGGWAVEVGCHPLSLFTSFFETVSQIIWTLHMVGWLASKLWSSHASPLLRLQTGTATHGFRWVLRFETKFFSTVDV